MLRGFDRGDQVDDGTDDGMSATRVSPAHASGGTPTLIGQRVAAPSFSQSGNPGGSLSVSVSRRFFMVKLGTAAALMAAACTVVSAQVKKPAATNSVTYDVTITADGGAYTGKMDLAVKAAKVTGKMHLTQPTEITGNAAGTVKAGELLLDFPYTMVQRKCEGQIEMKFKQPVKMAPSTGTVSIAGCGRDPSNKLAGTIELKPIKK
jgi:hypothetical protein